MCSLSCSFAQVAQPEPHSIMHGFFPQDGMLVFIQHILTGFFNYIPVRKLSIFWVDGILYELSPQKKNEDTFNLSQHAI